MNTFTFLSKAARHRPEQAAIVCGEAVLNYREFAETALRIAGNLRALGLAQGDRVAFCLTNSPRILEVIYACFAAGLIVVPVNARLHPKEIAYIAQDSGAKVLIHGPEYQQGIEEHQSAFTGLHHRIVLHVGNAENRENILLQTANALPAAIELDAGAPAWLFYTSGTTGKPKGALWSHRTIRVIIMNYLADLYNIQPGENVAHCAPLSHGSGIIALPAIARGATNIIYDNPSFDPRSLFQLIERYRVSHIAFMAPTQIVKCLEEFDTVFDLGSLRGICYGGAPIYVEHLKQAMEAFGPVFIQLYGQGEAPITISGMSAQEHSRFLQSDDPRIGSAGTIRTDVEVCCADDEGQVVPTGQIGEIIVRGDVVMDGYWNNPTATAETIRNGWLFTGDIGRIDADGYLFLLDRSKDVIITGGNNVYPREVEEVLVQHPSVANAIVIGIPDDYWGEAVHAVIQLKPGQSSTASELIGYCAESLASYKKPKAVDFVESFPISGYGKVLRREIRDQYWLGRKSAIAGGNSAPSGPERTK